jgi:hypothetical protein
LSTLQKRIPGVLTSATVQTKELNAETVTALATGFLKRIGHKGSLKAKRVSLEESTYTVEVEMKTHEIRSYEIQPKSEEAAFISISPKMVIMTVIISSVVDVALYFALKMFGF